MDDKIETAAIFHALAVMCFATAAGVSGGAAMAMVVLGAGFTLVVVAMLIGWFFS